VNQVIKEIEKEYYKEVPKISPGDTVKVHYRIKEGNKERIQMFQGTVIGLKNDGINKTFTVRKISFGVGVERIFPMHSPKIAKIDVLRKGRVRRAKLYYLRDIVGEKATRIKEKVVEHKKNRKSKPKKEDETKAKKSS